MSDSFQEKTEQPTEKRLEDARKKGKVAISREVNTSIIILFSTIFLYFMVSKGFQEMFKVYANFARNANMEVGPGNMYDIFSFALVRWWYIVVPVFAIVTVLGLAGSIMQSGFMWSFEALSPDMGKMNPAKGIKNLVSKKSFVELLKSIIKIILLIYVARSLIVSQMPVIFGLTGQDPGTIVSFLGQASFSLTLKIGIIFLFLAALDFAYQKWDFKKSMMMTMQEVKEEHKEREGNPLVKGRIRNLQREMARRRMMDDVKTADVIVTNPTHFAVALKYRAHEMPAPKVVARGAGFVALRIKEVAAQHRVPLVENKPLAQGLYHAVNVGDYIPEKFYLIVAELLAGIFKRKGRGSL
ncbi:MAG: flagellar biosynthesis protein FlhB [Syntrophorhabdaceae bacterium]|nr:flagellar biosynthesis protein FlhB [Syntrophorhabdaceae bacterium]